MCLCDYAWRESRDEGGERAGFSQQRILFSNTLKFPEKGPWTERKKHVKKLLKMKYRFVRLQLLDYLKYNFKKNTKDLSFSSTPYL